MTTLLTREWDVHFRRRGRGASKELHTNQETEDASARGIGAQVETLPLR